MPLIQQVVLIVERKKKEKKRISNKCVGVDDRDTRVKRMCSIIINGTYNSIFKLVRL